MHSTWLDLRGVFLNGFTSLTGREHFRQLLAELIERAIPTLVPKFVGYSICGMLAELTHHDVDRSVRARELSAWIDRARALGMRVEIHFPRRLLIVHSSEEELGFQWNVPELADLPPSFAEITVNIEYRTTQPIEVSPYVIPIPHLFQAETRRKYAAIPTLGHLLAVATADRRYLPSIQSMHELIPLLVLGLARIPSAILPFYGFPPRHGSPELRALSDRAAAWLADAMPSEMLRGHIAEAALHAFVTNLLRGEDEEEVLLAATEDDSEPPQLLNGGEL
jgi:hypothetical protein